MLPKFKDLENKTIVVTQTSSDCDREKDQKDTLKGLGLRGIGKEVELKCTKDIYGMLVKVSHLIRVNLK